MTVLFATSTDKQDNKFAVSRSTFKGAANPTRFSNWFSFLSGQNTTDETMVVISEDSFKETGLQNDAYFKCLSDYITNMSISSSGSNYQLDVPFADMHEATYFGYIQTHFKDNYIKQEELSEQINSQLKDFNFTNKDKVITFLQANNEIIDFIKEADTTIHNYFGNDAELILDLRSDPEEDYKELFILIKTRLDYSAATKILRKFDNEWFVKHLHKTKSKINIEIQ
jgi:hypothetical protein